MDAEEEVAERAPRVHSIEILVILYSLRLTDFVVIVVIEKHRHEGVYIARGKEDMLVTLNFTPGETVYGEKKVVVEGETPQEKKEYRQWNPFR